MRSSDIANRYARAIFEIAKERDKHTLFHQALETTLNAFQANKETHEYILSPLVLAHERELVLSKVLKEIELPIEVKHFVLLLAKKDRLPLLKEILVGYQALEDESNQVTRGVVKSTQKLDDGQRNQIQKSIEVAIQKKVLLNFEESTELLGGIVAQVGSLTIDDSLSAHLRRIKEDLNRRMN